MIGKLRFILATVTVLMVFVFSAMWAVPAFADDSVPPPPVDVPAEVAPPTTDTPVVDQTAVPTSQDSLAQVPEGTDVVAVNTSSDSIPLASQETVQTIITGDPIWCPSGVAPKVSAGGCSVSYGSLSALVAGGSHAANGTVWIEAGGPFGSVATFDGTPILGNWASAANFSLTLQGGWNGAPLSKTIIGVSVFDTGINIINWNGAVTVNDITFQNATNTAYPGTGALYVTTSSSITLSDVTADNTLTAATSGAFLNNTSSATAAGVTVNNSSFTGNTEDGLDVSSKGIVTTKNIVASNNTSIGVYIDNNFASTDKAVKMTGIQQFNNNSGIGLVIYSDGQITLSNVVANENGMRGTYLDNMTSLGHLGITIGGSSSFLKNTGGNGLELYSFGNVLLNSVNASNNGGDGVYINNCDASANKCLIPAAKTVTLTGMNVFNSNGGNGLEVYSFGSITLNNVTASSNSGGDGTLLSNMYYSAYGAFPPSSGTIVIAGYGVINNNNGAGLVAESFSDFTAANLTANNNIVDGVFVWNSKGDTLTGINTFNNNSGSGLYLLNGGKVTISNMTANFNNGYGAYISATSSVTLTGLNTFNNNINQDGLNITANGAVSLSNVTADNNGNSAGINGVYIVNNYSPAAPLGVTLSGTNTFMKNTGNGLFVDSYGAITISNLTASFNFNSGANLNNYFATSITPAPVSLTGFVHVNNSTVSSGLSVISWGAVTLANVTADNNYSYGVWIHNNNDPIAISPTHPKHTVQNGVTVTGTNEFNGNAINNTAGLEINSYSAVGLSNVTANNNHLTGIVVSNNYYDLAVVAKPVTITGYVVMYQNLGNGMLIDSNGAVSLANVSAYYNSWDGMIIQNNEFTTVQSGVTISGTNTFFTNGGAGLYIHSYGAVTLSNITAAYNVAGNGVEIQNTDGALPKPVTITGYIQVNNNSYSGLYLYSDGAVLIANITAGNNTGGYGAYIDNNDNAAGQFVVTLSGNNTFNGNSSSGGLYIVSHGTVLLNNITANGNTGNGVNVDNTHGTFPKTVTFTGFLNTSGNFNTGTSISSDGAVTLSNVLATGNGNGLRIMVSDGLAQQSPVTINGTNTFSNNGNDGLNIGSYGAITLNNISANGNGFYGTYLDNTGGTLAKNITLTGVNTFTGNANDGLYFNAHGAVILNRVTANGNTNGAAAGTPSGINGTTTGAITLVCGVVTKNEGKGYSLSGSTVTIKGIFTYGNPLGNTTIGTTAIVKPCALP